MKLGAEQSGSLDYLIGSHIPDPEPPLHLECAAMVEGPYITRQEVMSIAQAAKEAGIQGDRPVPLKITLDGLVFVDGCLIGFLSGWEPDNPDPPGC